MGAAQEERHGQGRKDEDVDVLGEEEKAEAHAAVLGGESSHQLRVSLGEVEGRAASLGRGGDEEDDQRQRLLPSVPVEDAARLVLDDLAQVEGAGQQDHAMAPRMSGSS